jgi:uncharacterized membrane protein
MNPYPEVVAAIVNDYLERLKLRLKLVPIPEQNEFLKEIQSHIYEAYNRTPGADDTQRILAVLRNLGEPAEVVADRLPGAMMRSGAGRNVPLYILGGILIAIFGVPLGFGGLGVFIGVIAALAGIMVAYYAVTGSVLLVGTIFMLLGLIRIVLPELWDKLIVLGFIRFDGQAGEFLDHLTAADQGLILILFASVFIASGVGLLRLGKRLLQGLRFLFSLILDWARRTAQSLRRRLSKGSVDGPILDGPTFVTAPK